jgi:His-Xaa-Ser system protein HxsD
MGAPLFVDVLGSTAISIRVDGSIYPISAIARAAFRFSDRAACLLAHDDESHIVVWATFLAKQDSVDLKALAKEFIDELLDQKLRQELEAGFHDVRLIITAQAFAEGNLLNADDDTADYRKDPRSIADTR